MARPTTDSRSNRSDRPLAPRLPAELDSVDLATITTGEWTGVHLVGVLPADFDQPLHLSEVLIGEASLVGARLEGSRLVDVAITGTDLSGVDLHGAAFTRVEVRDARMSGGQLAQARFRDVRFVETLLDGVNFAMSTAERTRFERCRMDSVDFRAARLGGVAWWDCDLTDAEFSQVNVKRAQMHGSRINGLRGATSLVPVAIDEDQFPAFAAHVLASIGVTVTDRTQD